MTGSAAVDEYIAALPEGKQGVMRELRELLTTTAPEASEAIAYRMPALRLDGRFFMSYDAYRQHFSLFPSTDAMIDTLGAALKPHLAGKGTLQFKAGEPLPRELIRRIVEIRLAEFGVTRR